MANKGKKRNLCTLLDYKYREDGHGEAYYTFGSRAQKGHENYYNLLYSTYKSLSSIIDRNSIIAQLVAFSRPDWQLSKYLEVMEAAGYKEIILNSVTEKDDEEFGEKFQIENGIFLRKLHYILQKKFY